MLTKKLQEAAGNAAEPLFVESVFSTYLYTGNGSTQTITNGIDLDGEGGLVWIKQRSNTAISGGLPSQHLLFDTQRGANNMLASNSTYQNLALSGYSFNSNGFSVSQYTNIDPSGNPYEGNYSPATYASWTFRKAPKFFDVVTYTGDGSASKSIAHNLGAVPGCIIVKATSTTGAWAVWHRSGTQNNQYAAFLEQTGAYGDTGANIWGTGGPSVTSSSFTVGTNGTVNASGATYVAYLFAHDAGGFGADGTENVISCGSYTGAYPSTVDLNLGFEPQWILVKNASQASNWGIFDVMRGLPVNNSTKNLAADSSAAENGVLGAANLGALKADGFTINSGLTAANVSGDTHIYIAIRRPMKTPESGTEVFGMDTYGATTPNPPALDAGWPVDMGFWKDVDGAGARFAWIDRLRGTYRLFSDGTDAEALITSGTLDYQTGMINSTTVDSTVQGWMFRRAPGFFDVVCYTATNTSAQWFSHSLTVVPELMIVKSRSSGSNTTSWAVYHTAVGAQKILYLNSIDAVANDSPDYLFPSVPTSTQFRVGYNINTGTTTYVAYLFATVAGVSKVGSYTGTGTTLQIDCGFAAGARFVLIKATSTTGDWLVWDSSRGIVAGDDPYLALNSTAAEVTNTDWVDTYSAGFELSSAAGNLANTNGVSYIYLSVA